MEHVLVIDSDPAYAKMMEFLFREEGYTVTTVLSPFTALEELSRGVYDLIVLDTALPGMDGLELCRSFRMQCTTPIIFVAFPTCRKITDEIMRLQAANDSYVSKPFDPNELLVRASAALHRGSPPTNSKSVALVPDLIFDPLHHTVTFVRQGKTIFLTQVETRLLHCLVRDAGQIVPRDVLAAHVWGENYPSGSNLLDVYINRLRTKLEEDPGEPQHLLTARGVGYKFQPRGCAI